MPEKFGPYRLIRELGAGGTARIYLAERADEPDLRERLVVKRLLPELLAYEEAIALFVSEAQLALRCAHPNVTRIYDHGQVGSDYYIAMEYIDGVELAQLIEADGRPGLGEGNLGAALRIVLDVCVALEHVHRCRVVHGDVNPRNILVTRTGIAKLIDFGVAAEMVDDAEEGTRQPRGTWAYMSPEQVKGQPIDRQSDVFSMGVVLWELMASKRLFYRGADAPSMAAVVEDAVPTLDDRDFDRICQRALAKVSTARYTSCAALARDIEAILKARGIEATAEATKRLVARLAPSTNEI